MLFELRKNGKCLATGRSVNGLKSVSWYVDEAEIVNYHTGDVVARKYGKIWFQPRAL